MAHISGQPVNLPIAVTPGLIREPRCPIRVISTTVTFTTGTFTTGTITIGAP